MYDYSDVYEWYDTSAFPDAKALHGCWNMDLRGDGVPLGEYHAEIEIENVVSGIKKLKQ
jgi:hypothetical protein